MASLLAKSGTTQLKRVSITNHYTTETLTKQANILIGILNLTKENTMKLTQYSLDEGMTWHDIENSVRICFAEVDEDDDEGMIDLYATVTSEGIVLDTVFQKDEVYAGRTVALDRDSLLDLTF